jgi:hypothetical protein
MFYHSFNKYMEHAYPLDELMPLSCKGEGRRGAVQGGDEDDNQHGEESDVGE